MRLASCFTPARLAAHLHTWQPYPPVTDRAFWNRVPQETREHLLTQVAPALAGKWPLLTATEYARFGRDGDRQAYERPYFARRNRLTAALLTAILTGNSSSDITDGVWLLCEESTWCLPAHQPGAGLPDPDDPYVDLFAAETAALLAWTTLLTGANEGRVRREIRTRVLDPYRARDDWWWLGLTGSTDLNNWTPWIHANLLTCTLLLDEDETARQHTAERIVAALDRYLDAVPEDGGCDEGIAYWWRAGASLFECLQTLTEACGDDFGAFEIPKIHNIARYPLAAHIAADVHVNFADAPIRPHGADPHLLYRFARRIGDDQLKQHALAMSRPGLIRGANGSLGRVLATITDAGWAAEFPAQFPAPAQTWLAATGVLAARERPGDTAGLFLAAKAGHNDESHNHNDVGSFVVALDGRPLLIDVGVGTYTRQTFGQDRYQIWTMQSSWHNTPAPGGLPQAAGRAHRATQVAATLTPTTAELAMELAAAYPAAAGVRSWRRTLRLDRTRPLISIRDDWETHTSERTLCYLITPEEPEVAGGRIVIPSGLLIDVDADGAPPLISVERRDLDDPPLTASWGEHLYRITLSLPGSRGSLSTLIRRAGGARAHH
jgi:hypothetical protein